MVERTLYVTLYTYFSRLAMESILEIPYELIQV